MLDAPGSELDPLIAAFAEECEVWRVTSHEELLARHPDYGLAREPGWVQSRWARAHGEIEISLDIMPTIDTGMA